MSNRQILLLLTLSHFSVDLYGSFLAPMQPFLTAKHNLTLTQAGFLVSLLSVSASLLQPIYGFWADRSRKRIFVVLATLLAGTFMSLISVTSSHTVLMLCLFLGGVGIASFHPQASSISHAVSGSRKGLGMSLFISGGNFGTAFGPLFIMFIVIQFGLDSTYIAAIPGILLTIALLLFCPQVEQKSSLVSLSSLFRGLRTSAGPLSSLYVIVVFRTLVQLSFLTYIPILLRQLNFSPLLIGATLTSFTGIGALGGVTGGFLYDRIGGRNLFLVSSLAAPVFLLLTAQAKDPMMMILLFALGGFCLMMTIPVSVLIGQTIVPGSISTISSLMMGFGWGMGGLLVPLAGSLADSTSIPIALG